MENQKLEFTLSSKSGLEEGFSLFSRDNIEFRQIVNNLLEIIPLYQSYYHETPKINEMSLFIERDAPESEFELFKKKPYANMRKHYIRTDNPAVSRAKFYNFLDEFFRRASCPSIIRSAVKKEIKINYPSSMWEKIPVDGALNIFISKCENYFLRFSKP